MGTTVMRAIVDRVRGDLQDNGPVRHWSDAEILGYANAGVAATVGLKPDAYPVCRARKLSAGTRQALTASDAVLLKVTRNLGTDGLTPGRVITKKDQALLDKQLPDWHRHRANAEVLFFVYDSLEPNAYSVYPPQPAANQGYVEEVVSQVPAAVAMSAALPIADKFVEAISLYCLARCYGKDAENTINMSLAQDYREAYLTALGMADDKEQKSEPR